MKGIDIARDIFNSAVDGEIIGYGDPDVDGVLSLKLIVDYFKSKGKNIAYFINPKRIHGFLLNPQSLRGKTVICVDFAVDYEKLKELVDNDCKVVVIDHHHIEDNEVRHIDNRAVVINNQYSFEPPTERYLSGAGVVYKVLCSLDTHFSTRERDAIVGLTLLSDAREIENEGARYYLSTLYNIDTTTGYFKYLLDNMGTISNFTFGRPKFDRNFVDYTFSPKVNSLFRFGNEFEATQFILGNGLTVVDTHQRQRELVRRMKEKMYRQNLQNIDIIYVNADDFEEDLTCFIGYLCNDVKGSGKSVIGFVFKDNAIIRASFRGRYDDIDYIHPLQGIGLNAQGHNSAFGIPDLKPTPELWQSVDYVVGELDKSHKQTVKVIPTQNLSLTLLKHRVVAEENCYVRPMFRTFFKYEGSNYLLHKVTYKMEEVEKGNHDTTRMGKYYKYILDEQGNKIPKYYEYLIDSSIVVKSTMAIPLENNYILPIMEKGSIALYIQELVI